MGWSCADESAENFPAVQRALDLPARTCGMAQVLFRVGPPRWASIGGAHRAKGEPQARTPCAIWKKAAAQNLDTVRRTIDFPGEHFSQRARSTTILVRRRKCWQGPEFPTGRESLSRRARYTLPGPAPSLQCRPR